MTAKYVNGRWDVEQQTRLKSIQNHEGDVLPIPIAEAKIDHSYRNTRAVVDG
jgi:hypothetical protein